MLLITFNVAFFQINIFPGKKLPSSHKKTKLALHYNLHYITQIKKIENAKIVATEVLTSLCTISLWAIVCKFFSDSLTKQNEKLVSNELIIRVKRASQEVHKADISSVSPSSFSLSKGKRSKRQLSHYFTVEI